MNTENNNILATKVSFWKKISLFLSWLFVSPVFLILSSIWKYPKVLWRIILTIFSPFTLIIGLIFFVLLQPHGMIICDNPSEYTESYLESKLDIDIPGYLETNHRKDFTQRIHTELVDFNYNYNKKSKFFRSLKHKVKVDPAHWSEDANNFIYEDADFHFFIHKDGGTGRVGVQLNHPASTIIKM